MKSAAIVESLEIAKHDEQGRRIADRAEKRALVTAYEASGMTQRAFAKKEGINYYTFATWLRKKRLEAAPARPQRFLELSLSAPATPGFPLEVVFPDGLTVRGSQAKEVAVIARALR